MNLFEPRGQFGSRLQGGKAPVVGPNGASVLGYIYIGWMIRSYPDGPHSDEFPSGTYGL